MSALRVVLLAEGSGEVGPNVQRGPNSPIAPDDWGPGHELFARAIASRSKLPREAVRFLEPLRTSRATIAKGSNLLHRKTLRQLLSYFLPTDRPDLMIVLVDGDGEPTRKRELEVAVTGILGSRIIAVAVHEFESWLISDPQALVTVLSAQASQAPGTPEALKPAEAKALLNKLSENVDGRQARLNLAKHLDLSVAASRCPAFASCLAEIAALKL